MRPPRGLPEGPGRRHGHQFLMYNKITFTMKVKGSLATLDYYGELQ